MEAGKPFPCLASCFALTRHENHCRLNTMPSSRTGGNPVIPSFATSVVKRKSHPSDEQSENQSVRIPTEKAR